MRRIVALIALLGSVLLSLPGDSSVAQEFAPPPRLAPAQFPQRGLRRAGGRRGDSGGLPPTRLSAPSRTQRQRLKRVQEALEAGNSLEATQTLQQFLDRDDEVFLTPDDDDKATPRSLKDDVLRQLKELPAAAQDLYELQYGPVARRLLEEATEENQPDKLVWLARRYLHTSAGSEGAYRLASLQMDAGDFLPAARLFDRLRQFAAADFQRRFEPAFSLKSALAWQRLGEKEHAAEIIRGLQKTAARPTVVLGGEETPLLKSPERVLAWLNDRKGTPLSPAENDLADWRMVRGNTTHTGSSRTQAPYLNSSRHASLLTDLLEEPDRSVRLANDFKELSKPAGNEIEAPVHTSIPAFQPLAVGGLAVVRTFADLRAYHLNTGELAWISAEKDDMLTRLIQSKPAKIAGSPFLSPIGHALKHRAWRDATYGNLCSDGKLVYAIEETDFIGPYFSRPAGTMPGPFAARISNRLKAYDLQTGRLTAEFPAGGDSEDNNRVFFLGPPLVLEDRLYCLAESLGEIRLLVLRPDAPVLKLEWSQPLATAITLDLDPMRRLCGLTPAARDGLLICPTEAGAVVALDLTTRSFAWGYVYATRGPTDSRARGQLQKQRLLSNVQTFAGNDDFRWIDSAVIVDGGRVVFTIRDIDEIHCLDLASGKLLWKRPRESGLFVAGVHDGNVVVISRGEGSQAYVQAHRLTDGESVWPRPTILPLPSGQGFRHGPFYYLPLSTAEVATLDLSNGKIVARSRSRDGVVPGNLAASAGTIVSQVPDALHLFPQFDELEGEVAQRLKKNPRDAAALALRGEIDLQRGRTKEALVSFREALAVSAQEKPYRELLLSSLLEGLRVDFTTYRGLTSEIERLEPGPEQWGTYLLSLASGLEKAGDTREAFAAYLRFCDPRVSGESLERFDENLAVRRDLLAYGRLRKIYAESPAPLRKELDELIRRGYAAARERAAPEELSRWLAALPEQIPTIETRRLLLDRMAKKGMLLERERSLRELARSSDKIVAGESLNSIVKLLVENGRAADALYGIERLRRDYGDVVIQEGKTGTAIAAQWEKQAEVARELENLRAWPTGQVETRSEPKPAGMQGVFYPVPIQETAGNFFTGVRLEVSQRADELTAYDRTGREWWSLVLDSSDQFVVRNLVRAWSSGHLLVVALPRKLVAIDTLSLESGGEGGTLERSPRILWQMPLSGNRFGQTRFMAMPGGRVRNQMLDEFNQPTGAIGPVTDRFLGVQRGRKLLGVDPLTGKILWIRDNAGPIDELAGDEDMLLVYPPPGGEAEGQAKPAVRVYSTVDGSLLGTRPLPPGENPQAFIGRSILTWESLPETGRRRLSLWDVWKESRRWEQSFAPGAVLSLHYRDEAAVMEPLGRLALLRTDDGRQIWESALEPDPALQNLIVLRGLDRYLAVASGPLNQVNGHQAQSLDAISIPVAGTVYGLESATGKKIWSTPVESQAVNPMQTADLPIMVFTCRIVAPQPPGQRYSNSPAILCLDSRNGRTLFDGKLAGESLQSHKIVARPDSKSIEVQLGRSNLIFNFTDKPYVAPKPPQPPGKDSPPRPPAKSSAPRED